MRKLLTLTLFMTLLAGCTESEVRKVVNDFVNDNKNITESQQINGIHEEINNDRETFASELSSLFGFDDETTHKVQGLSKLNDKITELKTHVDYEVKNININNNETLAKIQLHAEYVDIGELVFNSVSDVLDRNILKIYTDEEITKENLFNEIISRLNEELSKLEHELTEQTVEVILEKKNDEWVTSKVNQSFKDSMTLGTSKYIKHDFNEKFAEVAKNKEFLRVETTFAKIFDIMQNIIDENEDIDEESILEEHKETLLNQLKVLDIDVKIGEGKNVGVYYISKGEDNHEMKVSVKKDDDYSMTRKLRWAKKKALTK